MQKRGIGEDGTPYLLKCLPYNGNGPYMVTKVTTDDAQTVKDIGSLEQFCEMFGIKNEGKEMLMAANDVLLNRRADDKTIRDIREVWDKSYVLEEQTPS